MRGFHPKKPRRGLRGDGSGEARTELVAGKQIQIQIQIQIESLHTRLDEASEMTNTGVVPAGPFLSTCTMREPRAMLAASHSP